MLKIIMRFGIILTVVGFIAVFLFYILFYSYVVNVGSPHQCAGVWVGSKCIGGFK